MCVYGRVLRIRWAKVHLFVEIAITLYTLFSQKGAFFHFFAPKASDRLPFRENFALRREKICAPVGKRIYPFRNGLQEDVTKETQNIKKSDIKTAQNAGPGTCLTL